MQQNERFANYYYYYSVVVAVAAVVVVFPDVAGKKAVALAKIDVPL